MGANELRVGPGSSSLVTSVGTEVFVEGLTTVEAQTRYRAIRDALEMGWLVSEIESCRTQSLDSVEMSSENHELLRAVINSVTADEGRGVAGLCVLLATVKAICPEQSVRLHKGSTRRGTFSWTEGIPMRSIDAEFVTPALRASGLLQLNQYGIFMTRTLAENYPYTSLYKAAVEGAKEQWLKLVDLLESREINPLETVRTLLGMLWNQSDEFSKLKVEALETFEVAKATFGDIDDVRRFFQSFFKRAPSSARLFELALHSFYQVFHDRGILSPYELKPLSQMRSANKKHGNVGDIEVVTGSTDHAGGIQVRVAWDAKFGKLELDREVLELRDKLAKHGEVEEAGFVVEVDHKVLPRTEYVLEGIGKIQVMGFDKWTDHARARLRVTDDEKPFAMEWLQAFVQSLCQMRREIAPIDEPSVEWLRELTAAMGERRT